MLLNLHIISTNWSLFSLLVAFVRHLSSPSLVYHHLPLSKSQIALSDMHHPVFGIIFLLHSVNHRSSSVSTVTNITPSLSLLFEHSVHFSNWLELRLQVLFRSAGSAAMRRQLRQVLEKLSYWLQQFQSFTLSACRRYLSFLGSWMHSVYSAHYPVTHWPFSKARSAQEHFTSNAQTCTVFSEVIMRLNTVVVNLRLFVVLSYIHRRDLPLTRGFRIMYSPSAFFVVLQ